MNPALESIQVNAKRIIEYYWADYHFAPGQLCHVRNPNAGEPHPLCSSWIVLDEPLYQPLCNRPICLTAKAISTTKACLWWHPLQPSKVSIDLFYTIEKTQEASYYLIFHQSQPQQLITPFRLIIFPITENFPKPEQFWKLAMLVVTQLPTLTV